VLALVVARVLPQPPARRRFDPKTRAAQKLVGGLLWRVFGMPWRVSSPFVVLERREEGVRIGPNGRWLSWLVPTWDVPWSEMAEAAEYQGGLRLRLRGSRRELKFLAWPSAGRKEIARHITERLSSA